MALPRVCAPLAVKAGGKRRKLRSVNSASKHMI
jgi:hypothetical protein